jgi:regulator of sigma E protease
LAVGGSSSVAATSENPVTGRPLPARIGEIAQRAGVGLLFMLMALAVFNDLVRLL